MIQFTSAVFLKTLTRATVTGAITMEHVVHCAHVPLRGVTGCCSCMCLRGSSLHCSVCCIRVGWCGVRYHNRVTDSNLCVCISMATGVVVKRAQFRQHLLQ